MNRLDEMNSHSNASLEWQLVSTAQITTLPKWPMHDADLLLSSTNGKDNFFPVDLGFSSSPSTFDSPSARFVLLSSIELILSETDRQ